MSYLYSRIKKHYGNLLSLNVFNLAILQQFPLQGFQLSLCLEHIHSWGPCVVRGQVDGHFLVWWVIDNVVWTNFWLSIARAGCGLTGVGAGEEQAPKVVASEASWCGEDKLVSFEGPGGQWSQVRAAWWQEWEDEVMDNFLVEPQNQGRAWTTWEPSHEWWLAEATPSSRGFQWSTRKPLGSLVDPQSQDRRTEDGGAAASDRSDQCATMQSGDFEAEDTCRDRKTCIEAKQVCGRWAYVRWSDDKDFRILPRGACIPN
jgi:hypothetical protein